MELLEFIFRDGWHFIGTIILVLMIGVSVGIARRVI